MIQARLEPSIDIDGQQWAWKLILEWDADVHEWTLSNVSAGGVRLVLGSVQGDEVRGIAERLQEAAVQEP